MNILRKTTLAAALAATAVAGATPAMARDHYYGHRGGDTAGAAIAGGIIGLALGAIIASSNNHDRRDRYYDNRVYRDGYYYDRDGYRYDRDGYRYDRDNRRDDYYRRGYRDDGYYRGY